MNDIAVSVVSNWVYWHLWEEDAEVKLGVQEMYWRKMPVQD